jgi:hypothetical protein
LEDGVLEMMKRVFVLEASPAEYQPPITTGSVAVGPKTESSVTVT